MPDEPANEGEVPTSGSGDASGGDFEASAPEAPASGDAVSAEPETSPGPDEATEPAPEEETEPVDPKAQELLERVTGELGDAVIESAVNHGNVVVRVRRDAWRQVAETCKGNLKCDYLSFISAIDWLPAPRAGGAEGVMETAAPVQPTEMTFGVAGSEGRFQVFACVRSTREHHEILLKTDLDDQAPVIDSWVTVYPGADWHERECHEMFGIVFDGHPALRNLYLPTDFEGHPLRKDFPLLAREVKPWPGLVDVELMPGADSGETADAAAGGESS